MSDDSKDAQLIRDKAQAVADSWEQHQVASRKASGLKEMDRNSYFQGGYTGALKRLFYSPLRVAAWCRFRGEMRDLQEMLRDTDRKETGDAEESQSSVE